MHMKQKKIGLDDALARVIDMSTDHIDDIDSGIEEGIYLKSENPDLEKKRAARDLVEANMPRIEACLDVCTDVPTETLQAMGIASMERQRNRAHLDRLLFAEAREMLVEVFAEARRHEGFATRLRERMQNFIAATEADTVGRPAGKLVDFVEKVAAFGKWGAGDAEMEPPSDGETDSHLCLMDLVDDARSIVKPR